MIEQEAILWGQRWQQKEWKCSFETKFGIDFITRWWIPLAGNSQISCETALSCNFSYRDLKLNIGGKCVGRSYVFKKICYWFE